MSKSNQRVQVAVTVDLRDRFGWLKDAVQKMMNEAVEKERVGRHKPHVISVRAIAKSFARRMRSIKRMQGKADEEKGALLRMWAQHNATNIEGVIIKPSVSLSLDEEAVMGELDPKTRARVVEMRPHLKLPELFEAAKGNEKLQKRILTHLSAAATVSVTAPKD